MSKILVALCIIAGITLGIFAIGAFATYVSDANDFHRIEERDR